MKTLTIFTPAYNRAHTLPRTYHSLCRQTCKDFEWLVIDDGSTDNTKTLVEQWQQENKIPIRYIYQENQGMHGAHNTAYRNITTELNTCIDSDDWMPDTAVETIIKTWKEKGNVKCAGIVGLDYNTNKEIIGTPFPTTETTLNYFYSHGGKGDKKLVYRTDIIKKYPEYPIFDGERYFSLGYKYLLIDQDYKLITINKPLVFVDYQEDGSSYNMWKQYWDNPKGFMYLRKEHMRLYVTKKARIRSCIHYISHCFRARQTRQLLSNPMPIMTCFLIPIGYLLFIVNQYKVKFNHRMNINQ